jgi:type IV secretion system protein TrbC
LSLYTPQYSYSLFNKGKIKVEERHLKLACLVGVVSLCVSDAALASTFSSGMPWESPLEKVTSSLTGPVARSAGLLALTSTGVAWALGIGGDMIQKSARLGAGLSVAFNGATYILPMFGFAQGALL